MERTRLYLLDLLVLEINLHRIGLSFQILQIQAEEQERTLGIRTRHVDGKKIFNRLSEL